MICMKGAVVQSGLRAWRFPRYACNACCSTKFTRVVLTMPSGFAYTQRTDRLSPCPYLQASSEARPQGELIACPRCEGRYGLQDIVAHLQGEHELREARVCASCSVAFCSRNERDVHNRAFHQDVISIHGVRIERIDGRFSCDVPGCSYGTSSVSSMRTHRPSCSHLPGTHSHYPSYEY
jgi:hypothetical protein